MADESSFFSAREFLEKMVAEPNGRPRGDQRLSTVIRRHVEDVLFQSRGHQRDAAEILGVSPWQIRKWLTQWMEEDGIGGGAICPHCRYPRIVRVDGPNGYFKCLRCKSGFENV